MVGGGVGKDSDNEKINGQVTIDHFTKYKNDEKYKVLIDAHKGLNKSESDSLNHQLILLMMDSFSEEELNSMLQEI